jgi:cytochrome b561
MRLRNGPHGYGLMTKVLHWVTVAALVAQFGVGLTMEADDEAFDREDARIDQLEELGEDAAKQGGKASEEAFDAYIDRLDDELDAREDGYVGAALSDLARGDGLRDGISLPEAHVLLGVTLLALGLVRVVWRRTTPLPPWAPYLSARERTVESTAEKGLLASLFVVPLSGLLLVWVGTDWLWLHIAAQLLFLAALGVHVGLILRHTVFRRDGQLRRMLAGERPA